MEEVGPFGGLVICVTGLSKEARKQVRDATERLGGQYSPDLHPHCTHLVVQSFTGRKFEHALRHGVRNGLSIVTLPWFVDSVIKNVRLSEALYSVKDSRHGGLQMEWNRLFRVHDTETSCVPARLLQDIKQYKRTQQAHPQISGEEFGTSRDLILFGQSIYVDSEISDDVKRKVIDAAKKGGSTVIDSWFVGCGATYIVCEGPSAWRYVGHTENVVTPQWILETLKENCVQKCVHLSTDLARQVSGILENFHNDISGQSSKEHMTSTKVSASLVEKQQIVDLAKNGVRNRRGRHLQKRQTRIRPISPNTLLDYICWSITDSSSAASVYTDNSGHEQHSENTSVVFHAKEDGRPPEASFENLCRPLTESEKTEKIFKNHFLTILFPVDRFGEMGPCSRTFFSDGGFTCLQLLEYIHKFYQESMSVEEVAVAIHTDSKPADHLRSIYVREESVESGNVQLKRIDFLGTRTSFEMLKRVSGDNSNNVYELLLRA